MQNDSDPITYVFALWTVLFEFLTIWYIYKLLSLFKKPKSIRKMQSLASGMSTKTSLFYIYFYLKLPCLIYTWLKERLCRGKSAVIPIADTVEDESLNDVGETSEEDSGREEEDEEDSHTGFSSDESDKPPKVIRKITKPIVLENLKLTQREDSGYASGDFI
eukprot:g824.t1